MKLLSIVVPVFNEQEVLPAFYAELAAMMRELPEQVELIVVNDGSRDRTPEVLELSLDEQIWRDLKGNSIGRAEIIYREETEAKMVAHLEGLHGLPK